MMSNSIDLPVVAKVTLTSLLGQTNQRFRIPYYQRKYAWTRTNCEVLFEDIREVGERTSQTHFFSNVTLSPLGVEEGHYVVDGQQRVTTFSLFLEALRHEFGEAPTIGQTLRNCLYIGEMLKLSFEDQVDQRTYRHLLLRHFCDPESVSEAMQSNFAFFRAAIARHRVAFQSYLEDSLLERLLFVQVTLPAKMPPQRVFERMNATKLDVEDFDLIKNFLLMQAGDDEQQVYDILEQKMRDLYWRACVQAMVSMHACKQISQDKIYKPFREFFRHGPAEEFTALPFLHKVESWIQGFNKACWVFNHLGLTLDEWRVYGSDGYGALLMKLAVVFPSEFDEVRRNQLIVRIVESIRTYIAVERLNQSKKIHRRTADAYWTYKCLARSGRGYEKSALEEAIEKDDSFGVYSRESVNASIKRWVEDKMDRQGFVNNARSIGIAGGSTANAQETAEKFHCAFEERKQALGLTTSS